MRLEPCLQLVEHVFDLLRVDTRLCLHRIERLRLTEPGIAASGQQRQGKEQHKSQARIMPPGGYRLGRTRGFFEQAMLQFITRLDEFGLRQRSGSAIVFKLGQLVAIDAHIGGTLRLAVGTRRTRPAQQGRQEEQQDKGQQKRRGQQKNDGRAHALGSPESSRRCASRRCASLNGGVGTAVRRLR